ADATVHTAAAPLAVTGCSALPFSPAFRVSATRDSADKGVTVTTDITQAAAESPSRSVTLALPVGALSPNVASVKLLCANLASGTCTPVGAATATSPLYPRPLTGQAYLTGTFTGLTLTIVFPPPFPLTLTGTVDLSADATAFTGLPDIPLTDLKVTLNSGRYALFDANCATPSGPASAKLTDQNGDKSATAPARVTLAGCPGSTAGRPGTTGGRSGSRPGRRPRYRLFDVRFSGLPGDHPALSFRLAGGRLTAMTVELPAGLRAGGRTAVRRRVRTSAGGIRSVTVRHGHLVIRLRRAVASTTVSIRPGALREDGGLRRRARTHRLKRLSLTVVAARVRLTAHTTHLGL
ncbi:MAG TPA: hypothetical protein VFN87_13510, partial [Solirubrobacteraceae bacterium]|nr:hypothetical protein [Solirubrobacteraceae bacterium]